jgi:hypothetical protein
MVRGWWNAVRTHAVTPKERRLKPTPTSTRDGIPVPTPREVATILSVPTLLWLVYFLIQPVFDAWRRFGYLRDSVAASAPAARVAPEPLVAYADLWHELTRLSHALIHQPSSTHTHVFGNVLLIALLAWALLIVLTALGRRSLFILAYWELTIVAPVVGSFAFDLLGRTAHGYGASTIGFAFLGTVAVASAAVLLNTLPNRLVSSSMTPPVRPDNRPAVCSLLAGPMLILTVVVIASDLFASSPATPVHQAGAAFGVVVGAVVLLCGDALRDVIGA